MKNNLIIAALLCVVVYSVAAGDKIDVSAVVTEADAEAILGVPVKDAKGRNKEGSDGFYDSEWSYYAVKGGKALVYYDKSGLEMLNILKGNILITIGMHGVPAKTALEQEKLLAKKILA